jgi:hypothetical protein
MDPITALGLASNAVQFLSFGTELLKTARAIHRTTSTGVSEVLTLEKVYGDLKNLNSELLSGCANSSSYLNGPGSQPDQQNTSFRTLILSCQTDCEKLLDIVEKLKMQDGSKGRWQSFRTALKVFWAKDEIDELKSRLTRAQTSIIYHICVLARYVWFLVIVLMTCEDG